MELRNRAHYKKLEMGMFAVDASRLSSKGENNAKEIIKNSEKINY